MHTQLVVLGGGPGGYAAAFLAADLGMDVTLVEAEKKLGGTCLLRGCIPSKALLHVARVMTETRMLDAWGLAYDLPELDLDKMRSRKQHVLDTLSKGLAQLAKRRSVKVIHGRGVFVDSQTLEIEPGAGDQENQRLAFDHCIVATGSRPAIPKMFRLDSDRVMDSSAALDLPDVPASLLVVGGGYIGLEMGTVYAALGSEVTVVELTDGLLPGADRELVKPLQKHYESEETFAGGVLLNTKVVELKESKDGVEAALEGPEGAERRHFDRVLVAIGRQPRSSGLGLENTQVEIDDQGFVVVDSRQRTADPHILAIGDVAGGPMLAHKATHEGKVAAEFLHGGPAEFDVQAIPAVVFTDPEVAWTGLTVEQAKKDGREVRVRQYPWQASGRAQAVGAANGMTQWVIDPQTDRVLGAGIVGAGAGELISEAVLAIEMGCTARDVAESIHPHPTLSETLGFAAEVYLGTATEVYRPKKQK